MHDEDVFNNKLLDYVNIDTPKIGLAISGGGYRSMLTSTGFLQEMEKVGLANCLNYISGLSGGSWVLMDLILHDFNTNKLLKDWNLDDGLLKGIPEIRSDQTDIVTDMDTHELFGDDNKIKRDINMNGTNNIQNILNKRSTPLLKIKEYLIQTLGIAENSERDTTKTNNNATDPVFASLKTVQQIFNFYIDLHLEVRPKKVQGFQVSFTDYWGKALLKRLKSEVWSTTNSTSLSEIIATSPKFRDHEAPIPIIVSNCRNGFLRNIIFEFTPFEFGSWEKVLRLFIKIPYLGSRIVKGVSQECIKGYDDIGFIAATSSSVFNNVLIYIWQQVAKSSKDTIKAMRVIMGTFGIGNGRNNFNNIALAQLETYYALFQHNPFYQYPGKYNEMTVNDYLYLVDGGEDGENIPLRALLIPERQLDFIFVIDSSSDQDNFANGMKLGNIFKQLDNQSTFYKTPKEDFVVNHPIALGCNLKTEKNHNMPIIMYYANTNHVYPSNTSTFKITYNDTEVSMMVSNGKHIFSDNDNAHYQKCLGCLLIKRTFDRRQKNNHPDPTPQFCKNCYKQYCYD